MKADDFSACFVKANDIFDAIPSIDFKIDILIIKSWNVLNVIDILANRSSEVNAGHKIFLRSCF